MADRDYRWRDERSYRQPGGERDFYDRDIVGEDDYGLGYGESGMTNYRLLRSRSPSTYGYGDRERGWRGGYESAPRPAVPRSARRDLEGDFSSDYAYGQRHLYGRGDGAGDLRRARRDWDDDRRWAGRDGERGFWDRAGDEVASWFGDDDAERRREMDARHQGRGPKGYRRSDERIREDISDKLTDDPYIDATEIEIEVSGSEVTLTGTVDSRSARRRVEDLAERCSGVSHVQNNLRVASGAEETREEREGRKKGAFFGT